MKVVPLGDALVDLRTGPFGSLLHKSDYVQGGIPLVNPMHIIDEQIVADTNFSVSEEKMTELTRYILEPGHIVMGRRGEMGRCAVVREAHGEMICGTGSMILMPNKTKLDPDYAVRLLRTPKAKQFLENAASGVTMLNLNPSAVKELPIPLPPMEEQKRIAAILDQADALRRLRARALDRLNALGPAIFHEMFGDLVANERRFPSVTVQDIIHGFETGKNLAEDPDGGEPGAIRVLKISAVTTGTFKPTESKPLPLGYSPPVSHFVQMGDVLFSRANTEELIGATAIVEEAYENLVLPDKLWRFVWRQPSPVEPRFVLALFSSRPFRAEIAKRATGTSGSMKNIGQAKVLQIPFGLPSPELQAEYVRRTGAVAAQLRASMASKHAFETLFVSLQNRAFRGEL